MMSLARRTSGLDMDAYHIGDEPYQAGTHSNDDYDAETDGWEIVDPMKSTLQDSVRLEGLGIYPYAELTQVPKSRLKPQTKGQRNNNQGAPVQSHSLTKDMDHDWEFVPRDPDWDIINRREHREARRATQPETRLDDDWVVCDVDKDGEVEMFEGVRAEKRELIEHEYAPLLESSATAFSYDDRMPADLTSARSNDGDDEHLREMLSTIETAQAVSKQPRQKLRPTEKHYVSSSARPQARSRIPGPSRTLLSRTKQQNPSKRRPLSPEEEDLPFLPASRQGQRSTMQIRETNQYPGIMQEVCNLAATELHRHPRSNSTVNVADSARSVPKRSRGGKEEHTDQMASHWYSASFAPDDDFYYYG